MVGGANSNWMAEESSGQKNVGKNCGTVVLGQVLDWWQESENYGTYAVDMHEVMVFEDQSAAIHDKEHWKSGFVHGAVLWVCFGIGDNAAEQESTAAEVGHWGMHTTQN